MTMVVWAACDTFALMMADRRAFTSKVVPTSDGLGTELGEVTLGEDTTKALTSSDGRDIFGIAGTSPAFSMVRNVIHLHGGDVDTSLFVSVMPHDALASALDTTLLGSVNVVTHSYVHAAHIMCCRTQWSPTILFREIMMAPADKIIVVASGSGVVHLQGLAQSDGAAWAAMERQVDDWSAVRSFFFRLFRDVSRLDMGVGPDADTWLLTKRTGVWKLLDEVSP